MEHSQPDRLVVDSVAHVRDRCGVEGLRALVELATRELRRTEAAIRELGDEPAAVPEAAAETGDASGADTQTWQAFVDEGRT